MASLSRFKDLALINEAVEFDFFQLVRILKLILCDASCLYFKTLPSLAHPVNDIAHISQDNGQLSIWVTFMGLIGQSGVLPEHFSEMLLQKLNDKDKSLHDFIGIFSHRLITVFYEAWHQAHFFTDFDKVPVQGSNIIGLIDALTGINVINLTDKYQAMVRYYAGLFNQSHRSQQGLITLILDYFNLAITISNYYGKWMPVQMTSSNQLGIDAMLGKRAWYAQNQICIDIAAIPYKIFKKLMPDQMMLRELKYVINLYLNGNYEFTLKINVISDTIPYSQLNSTNRLCLGWNTWLKHKKTTKIAKSVQFNL